MKKRFFFLVAAFFAMMFVPSFQSSANAQSDKALADEFINNLRTELMNDKTGSVNVVGTDIELKIVAGADKDEPTAEFMCDVIKATQKYIKDNPSFVAGNNETMKYVKALSAVGYNFKLQIIDKNTNQVHGVALSPEEIPVFDVVDEMEDEMLMAIFSYMPFEKFVKHLNSMLEEAGMLLEDTGDYVYFVVTAPDAAEFQGINEFYMSDKAGFTEAFVNSFMAGAGQFAEMIYKFNRKVGVKIVYPGYSPIVINVE
jgi:hypothetical protein